MDDVQNRFARELADAVAAAVAQSADIDRCRERAKAAGYRLRLTLEATVGFAAIPGTAAAEQTQADADSAQASSETADFEISAADRRFLRSLRIAADETPVEEAN